MTASRALRQKAYLLLVLDRMGRSDLTDSALASLEAVQARLAATPALYAERYPVASSGVTASRATREEQAAQDAANERTLRQARRDVTSRIIAGMD